MVPCEKHPSDGWAQATLWTLLAVEISLGLLETSLHSPASPPLLLLSANRPPAAGNLESAGLGQRTEPSGLGCVGLASGLLCPLASHPTPACPCSVRVRSEPGGCAVCSLPAQPGPEVCPGAKAPPGLLQGSQAAPVVVCVLLWGEGFDLPPLRFSAGPEN